MVRRIGVENRIRELLARFASEAKLSSAMGRYDPHRISEDLLVPLFRAVFGYKNLRNLNQEGQNFPGVDLADDEAGVAIQVSASPGSDKIKHTLQQFVKHELYQSYNQLKVYVLTEKQRSYSGSQYQEIVGGRFSFDKDEDIWDFTTVGARLTGLDDRQLLQVLQVLESYYSESPLVFGMGERTPEEKVWLNLLELSFPDTLYLADIDVDRDAVIEASHNYRIRLNKRSNNRRLVRAALEQLGLKFAVDWVDYEGKIFTFHDLDDDTLPLNKVIDKGTLTAISPDEFYDVDENQERVFKSLLQRCLQQKLYHLQVQWQSQEELYFLCKTTRRLRYASNDGRAISILGVKCSSVFRKKEPDKTYYYKHLAFRTAFQRIGNSWYLQITPDWFFSHDGYHRSFYHEDNVSWVKRKENNSEVFNQLRFIVDFLKTNRQLSLLTERTSESYPFLFFGDLPDFSSPALIDDKVWKKKEEDDQRSDNQQKLEFVEE